MDEWVYLSGLLAGLPSNHEVQRVVCLPQLNLEQLLFLFSTVDLYQVNEVFRVSEEKRTGVLGRKRNKSKYAQENVRH